MESSPPASPLVRRPLARGVATLSLGAILAATLLVLAAGAAVKAPCASGTWQDGRQYRHYCYSDVVPLYGAEHLQGGRLPYVNACPAAALPGCDEYPVLTMWFMRGAAWVDAAVAGGTYAGFFWTNALGLGALALACAWALHRMVGTRALYFAVAPTLLIYAFVNWDLLAVAAATVGTLAFLRRRDAAAGVLLGLGAAAKLYPALLLLPFALERLRQGRRREAAALVGSAAAAWLVVDLPFALLARTGWLHFFSYNSGRAADWDSLWFLACTRFGGRSSCAWPSAALNVASVVVFAAIAAAAWWIRARRAPGFPLWTLGFPLLVAFLLANKVYSPQYGLWLLPWFAVALPNPWLFAAFEAADVAVFLTRFSWFGRLESQAGAPGFAGYHGVPLSGFEWAIAIRAALLLACVAAWAFQDRGRHATVAGGNAAVTAVA